MKTLTLNEIHDKELEILRFVDKTCNELGIKYYALYGTLIGCIRHHGFIPWDDDLDIGMLRNDYEKFLQYMQSHDTGVFYIDNVQTNKHYPFYISRVCDKRYSLVFESFNYTSGLFVDLYPIDGMGSEKDLIWWKKRFFRLYCLRKGLFLSNMKGLFCGTSLLHKILNAPLLITCKILGNRFFFNRLDQYSRIFSLEDSKYIDVICWTSKTCGFYEKEWFNSTLTAQFEDMPICIPKDYDKILKTSYGDYMALPPISQRIPSHGYKAYKLDNDELQADL